MRREIRTLTEADRTKYLDTLNTFYRVDLEEGREKYGPDFANNHYVTACHNSKKWCMHEPSQFLAVSVARVGVGGFVTLVPQGRARD